MKAIIFDMDGVLINTEPLHFKCWKILMEEDGINLTYDIYKPCIGSTREYLIQLLEERFGKLKRNPDELLKKMQQKKKEIVERDGFPFLSSSLSEETTGSSTDEISVACAIGNAVANVTPMRSVQRIFLYILILLSGEC